MGLGMIFRLGVRGYVVMLALAVFGVVVLGACGVSDEPKAVATVVVAAAPEATAAPTATVAVQAEPTATEEAEVE
jgi:hypothetical protein